MNKNTFSHYLKILNTAKDEAEKDKIFSEINYIVKNESSEERLSGINELSKRVDKLSSVLSAKALVRSIS